MTENERMVMDAILRESNFNFNKIDLKKSWEENEKHLEGGVYYAFADVKDYGCGLNKQATRAVFGSLMKKGMIDMTDDDEVVWIVIREKQFNNIIKEYSRA